VHRVAKSHNAKPRLSISIELRQPHPSLHPPHPRAHIDTYTHIDTYAHTRAEERLGPKATRDEEEVEKGQVVRAGRFDEAEEEDEEEEVENEEEDQALLKANAASEEEEEEEEVEGGGERMRKKRCAILNSL